MRTQIFLGKPPANVVAWIVKKAKTHVKYTAASERPDWEGDIVGELANDSIPNIQDAEVVEIGSHVTSIGNSTFYSYSRLASVAIPDSVTSIGNGAFANSGLMSVTFSGKDKATVQGMENYYWYLPSGCVLHCTDGDITI